MAANIDEIVDYQTLKTFCSKLFVKMNLPPGDAATTAEILTAADLRGIRSHGVARLKRYYGGIKSGMMLPRPEIRTIKETITSAVIDAGAGLGQPVSKRAMEKAIEIAGKSGIGFVTVRNSNHFGIAGFYSMMALEHDMIGICMTNSEALVIPTFGKNAMFGTNPISVAVPAGEEKPYVLDMATSVVPRGKLEVYERHESPIPTGWATDEEGNDCTNPSRVLENIRHRAGGGLLPLGGISELYSGHKGYGLVLLVEILSGVLSGSAFADETYKKDKNGNPLPANIGHFFGAVRIDFFREANEFKRDMDVLIRKIKESKKAEGESRIYIHGEKEYELEAKYKVEGVPLHHKVIKSLRHIAEETGIEYTL